jgi:hypothetical protein
MLTLSPVTASAVTATMINNLVDRCQLAFARDPSTPLSLSLYNNLFLNNPSFAAGSPVSALSLTDNSGATPLWEVKDNFV